MNILVIGNGFDIEHGLPTKYVDFLDFMKGIQIISIGAYIDKQMIFESRLYNPTKLDESILKHEPNNIVKQFLLNEKFFKRESFNKWKSESNVKELIDCSTNNFWIEYLLKNTHYSYERWVDFESEISKVIQTLEYANEVSIYLKNTPKDGASDGVIIQRFEKYNYDKSNHFDTIMKDLKGNLGNRYLLMKEIYGDELKNIIKILHEHLLRLNRCLEIYLCEYVDNIQITEKKPQYFKDDEYDGLISFNYTNTFQKLYRIKGTDSNTNILKPPYDYIHGKADLAKHKTKEENNMVLGINEYLNEEDKNEKLDFIQFKKYFQRIFKKTGIEYKKWIEEMSTSMHPNSITIFGHSLDVSDKDILRQLILESGCKVTIYYYDDDVVHTQLISNLVRVIGQNEFKKRIHGKYPTLIITPQSKSL